MGKSKKNKIKLSAFAIYAIVTTVLCLAFLTLKRDNLVRWIQNGILVHEQNKQLKELRIQNAELDRQIEALSTDRDSLEKYARETYGFSSPSEDVYVLE